MSDQPTPDFLAKQARLIEEMASMMSLARNEMALMRADMKVRTAILKRIEARVKALVQEIQTMRALEDSQTE